MTTGVYNTLSVPQQFLLPKEGQ